MSNVNRVAPWETRRCLAKHRLRKETFLAMYGDEIAYATDPVTGQRIETRGIPKGEVVDNGASGVWILHYTNQTREFFEQIDDDKWEIMSWDPLLNEVCVRIMTQTVPSDSGGNPQQNDRIATVALPNVKNYEF